MNRWASGVVSAAKSNLVGMDIRQPRARGTTPLHIQRHGGAQEHGCTVGRIHYYCCCSVWLLRGMDITCVRIQLAIKHQINHI